MSPAVPAAAPNSPPRPAMVRKKTREAFQAHTSIKQRQLNLDQPSTILEAVYIGIAVADGPNHTLDVAYVIHDATYSIDFSIISIGESNPNSDESSGEGSGTSTPSTASQRADLLADEVTARICQYRDEHLYKFVGAGLTPSVVNACPQLPSRLWLELDIVPLVLEPHSGSDNPSTPGQPKYRLVDEEADAVVRKAIGYFNAEQQPRLCVGFRNEVGVDSDGLAQITYALNYPETVHPNTHAATMFYADSLKKNGTRIAFFNSTPQGGGVALMRHALIRYLRLIGVDCKWYVPKPKPEVFRTTKNNHNILQGVADPDLTLDAASIALLEEWTQQNASRFWLGASGPLAPVSKGGAHIVIVDDPQMPALVRLAKEQDPTRPVIFRSHIQVRADLADNPSTPTAAVWNWVWSNVRHCDVFVSHPVRSFVPHSVTPEKVGYLPATTDWLDGLNKPLSDFDAQYYMHRFTLACLAHNSPILSFPSRPYIAQIARFDPAKGIPDVLASYALLRRTYMSHSPLAETPQLVIAGHGAIDDPDATSIFNQTAHLLSTLYADIASDVIVMRLGPVDQLLNVLLANAHVALQLSTREGFEVKVSEALHMGVPVIATTRGGIPLQIQHEKSGFLVEVGDHDAVARYLHHLFTDEAAYADMAAFAASHVSDEVSTVGNALAWLYLADTLAKGEEVKPRSRWINDMAREKAGVPYEEGETRLMREKVLLDLSASQQVRDGGDDDQEAVHQMEALSVSKGGQTLD